MKPTDAMYEAGMNYLKDKGTAWCINDLFEAMWKAMPLGTNMPVHLDLLSDCCGFFNDLKPNGLYCNECGKEISEAIGEFHNEVKDTLRAMWGGIKQGVHLDFRQCETNAMEKWLALSKKMGIFGHEDIGGD